MHIYIYIFVSPCVGGSIVPPRTLYCIKYQLGVYISAKPRRLICIHSHHKLHSGDTNYIKHAQIRYIYAIKHSPSGATRPRVSCLIAYTYLLGMLYLIHIKATTLISYIIMRNTYELPHTSKINFLLIGGSCTCLKRIVQV